MKLTKMNFSLFTTKQTNKFATLLVIFYKKSENGYIFREAKFWNMPTLDLEGDVKSIWDETVAKIKTGITFTHVGNRIFNNLPGSKEKRVIHVRPHTSLSAYSLNDGTRIGDISKDADELPDGQWMTKQGFWLNKEYIVNQLL